MEFTSVENEYVVLKLSLSDYQPTKHELDDEYVICGSEIRNKIRRPERKFLKQNFENWTSPYYGKMKGWQNDSAIYVLHNGRLVAGVYLCSENEFDHGERWGQLHYAFMDPAYKGKGIYSVLFQRAVEKAKSWNLEGLILNSDRYLLPDVYIRWGAVPWKTIPKNARPVGSSLLVEVIRRALSR
jgi:GNAT superfamily N-acetyltransferase